MSDRLLLIDGNSLVHRAFHALPDLTSPSGELTNATYGFAMMLVLAYQELKPAYVAAAFDTRAPTFRRVEYEAYKATRGPSPEGLSHQFGRVFQVLDALHVPIYRVDGFEADDILGTLARQAIERGIETIVLTGDMDAAQLVTDSVCLLVPVQGVKHTKLYNVQAVQERYGLNPAQIPDFKALRGDSSDNIPGVPGIGDKTASKLLGEYGTVEELYAHLDALPDKQRKLLEPYAEQVKKSKLLATIVCDVPVDLELAVGHEAAEAQRHPDRARLLELFHELGFRSLIDRLPGSGAGEGARAGEPGAGERGSGGAGERAHTDAAMRGRGDAEGNGHRGQLGLFGASEARDGGSEPQQAASRQQAAPAERVLAEIGALEALVEQLRAQRDVAVHVVLAGEGAMRAELAGLTLGSARVAPTYVPLGHSGPCLDWEQAREALRPLLEDEGIPKIAHNAKEQMIALGRRGLELRGLRFDTMIAGYLLQTGQRGLELRDLAWAKLQVELPPLTALTGTGRKAVPVGELEPAQVAEHATRAAELVCQLTPLLEQDLEENRLGALFRDVELPLVPVLAAMERNGVKVDVDYLQQLSRRLYERLQALEQEIYAHVGHQFNINSTQQLSVVLFQELKLPGAKRTRTGHVSTGAEVLEELRGVHPIVELLLEYRQLQKLKSTYVDALPLLVNPETGRVHTSFNQTVAATGRLSSSDPNLQNIPIRTDLGREVRRAFVAEGKDQVLLSADYSQIELRILAHVTQDPTLLEAFHNLEDIHAATAAEVMAIPIEQVTPDQRRLAKVVNFGVLYGMSGFGLASRTDLPREQATAFIDRYFQRFGTIKQHQDQIIREVEQLGYASTLLGRRRYIPEVRSPIRGVREAGIRQAINLPIQGTAADIVKIAMIRVHEALEHDGFHARMLLQVHDELVFELPEAEVDAFIPLLCRLMEGAWDLAAPLHVEVKVGRNWDEMKVVRRST